jgi:carbamoyltransferase
LQTVTKDENGFLYDLLGEFQNLTGFDVLLNTSFNMKGKPILSSISDALEILDKTKISAVWIEGWIFKRPLSYL